MLLSRFSLAVTGLLLIIGLNIQAQKNIIIDEQLASHSEPLKVKMGAQGIGKIAKWKFGEYAVVQSKNGWAKTTSKSNLLNTKTESKSTHKFSFTLCNAKLDSALVNAAENIEVKAVQKSELFPNLTIGEDELLLDSRNFTASITVNRDTTDTWILIMNTEVGSNSKNSGKAILFNKERKIIIISASSNKEGSDKRALPALGYEFIENDKTFSALQYFGGGTVTIPPVQYFGGGALRINKNIVWINNELDSKMKLILAAVMTSLMQYQMDGMTAMD